MSVGRRQAARQGGPVAPLACEMVTQYPIENGTPPPTIVKRKLARKLATNMKIRRPPDDNDNDGSHYHHCRRRPSTSNPIPIQQQVPILFIIAIIIIIISVALEQPQFVYSQTSDKQQQYDPQQQVPLPLPIRSASYISLDGLTLVIMFNKPVNLSASIESVEQRQAAAQAAAYEESAGGNGGGEETAAAPTLMARGVVVSRPGRLQAASTTGTKMTTTTTSAAVDASRQLNTKQHHNRNRAVVTFNTRARKPQQATTVVGPVVEESHATSSKASGDLLLHAAAGSEAEAAEAEATAEATTHATLATRLRNKSQLQARGLTCPRHLSAFGKSIQETPYLVGGIQLCAKLLTRKTLKLLHKYKLHNCLWASEVQFLIQLNKPIGGNNDHASSSSSSSSSSSASSPPLAGAQNSAGAQTASSVRITFRRSTLAEFIPSRAMFPPFRPNDQEVSVELSKLALEGLGVPPAPRLALTGPNQVPPCGHFSISAHLSSPYGTQPNESVRLHWSVERVGLITTPGNSSTTSAAAAALAASSSLLAGHNHQRLAAMNLAGQNQVPPYAATTSNQPLSPVELAELQWQALKQLVESQSGSNNLVLDAQLLQFIPQLYEFRLSATFITSLTSFVLNATHQVGRLDFDAPIGTIYGTHMLANEQQVNANSQLALMADIQVPACAQNIKQVGLYWQVSDPRVRFEQTYDPVYLAKSGALPEQALIEFRLNLFYGIRVKKFASASALVPTGDSVLDAQISDGLLMASIVQPQDLIPSSSADQSSSNENAYNNNNNNNNNSNQLVLYAISESQDPQQQQDKYTYQWTCFDGNTAQPCYKSLKLQASNGGTRYDVGQQQQQHNALARPQEPTAVGAAPGGANSQTASPTSGSSNMLLLVDRTRQRQPILRLPLSWFESDAQLWFGLQRFDRQNPSQHSKTEYALISVQPLLHFTQRGREPRVVPALVPQVSIGPLLIGPSRQRATMRNPLTGAMLLVAQAPAVVVGRISPSDKVASFFWRIPNYVYPLHWTTKNVTNPLSQRDELITELQLNQDTLLAHGQHQVQLIVCPDMDIPKITATISLDVVQGVSQCRVELVVTSAPGSKLQQPSLPDGLLGMQPVSTASSTSTPTGSGNGFQSVQRQAASQLPIVVTVNYCNIPLGMSPLTYQLYIIDTSSSDGFIEMNNRQQQQQSTGKPQPASSSSDDEDYINEADELFYENLAQPLSGPQLSPVFVLSGLNGLALMALMQQQQQPAQTSNNQQQQSVVAGTRIRFAARVCDRLQSCRMFYSSSIDPLVLMAQGTATGLSVGLDGAVAAANRSSSLSSSGSLPSKSERLEAQHSQRQQLRLMRQHAIETLRSMLEAAKRANTAGNSIAAISILNALMTLGQRMLPPPQATTTTSTQSSNGSSNNNNKLKAGTARAFPARAKLETSSDVSYSNETTDDQQQQADSDHQSAAAAEGEDQLDRLRDLLQVAMRDCLHYGAQSSQRQFHYTESGQTNLALAAISRILASPQAGFELKFRSLRLIALLVRKSIDNQLSSSSSSSSSQLRLQSLPDLKTIQLAYESLFGAFTQHSTEAFASLASTGHHQHQDNHHNGNNHHRAKRLAKEQVEEEERRTQAGAAESKAEGAEQARTLQRDAQQQQQQQQQQQARLDDDDNKILSRASQSRDRSNSSSSGDPRRELAERTLHHHHNDDDNGRHKRDQQPRQAETDWLLSSSLSSLSPSPPSSSSSSSSSAGVLEPVAPTGGATLESAASSTIATTTTATLATIQPNTAANQQQHTTSLKANRRNKEEAVLAYLKLTRQAHKALIQSIAMQLPLGAVQQFEYQSAGSPRSSTPPSTTSSSANTNNFNTNNNNSNNNNVAAAANRFIAAPQPPAYIVSSLTHQTGLLSDTIDVDLRDFGSISVSFGGAETGVTENVLAKLGRQMRQSTMRCRNGTQTKCSSFVLALTSFAGKAPFRSLDLTTSGGSTGGGTLRAAADIAPRLGVPIIQLDWLSPLDGSNLIELLQTTPTTTSNTGSERDQLVPEDFRATVTFTLPLPQAAALQNATSNDNGNGAPPNAYKCYRFNEAANEWVALAAASDERVPLDEAATAAAGASSEPVRRLRCSFDGYGVVGVFQGKPPPVESSTELSIAVGVACVLALVAIVSMLGCMASKTKARRANHHHKPSLTDTSTDSSSKTNGPSTGSSSYDSDPDAANDDDDDQRRNDRQQRTRRTTTPHHHLEHAMAFR